MMREPCNTGSGAKSKVSVVEFVGFLQGKINFALRYLAPLSVSFNSYYDWISL